MLVLTLKPDEIITIVTRTGELIRVMTPIDGAGHRICIDAPRDFRIEREKKYLPPPENVVS